MLPYNSTAFLINHINFAVATKRRWILFRYTKKTLQVLNLLKRIGIIRFYIVSKGVGSSQLVKLSPFFYKHMPFFRRVKLVSTPSKRFNLKLRTLQILNQSLGETIVVLETSCGIITHTDALKLKIGGKILLVIN